MSAIDCPTCHGAGEVPTRELDPETNWPLAETCWTCGGEGYLRDTETEQRNIA